MRPRIKIAEENYEQPAPGTSSDSDQPKKSTVPINKKIQKSNKQKQKKKQMSHDNKSDEQEESIDTGKVKGPHKFKHLAVCIPDSLVSIPQSSVLRAYFVSELARICTIFKVDEIIVLHDFAYKSKSDAFSPSEYMVRNLQYLQTPQYLRKYLFEIHPDLKNAGIMNPIDADHHLREDDICAYREGVVIERPTKANCGSWVDIGLRSHAKINYVLPPKTRVTVKINQPEKLQKFFDGQAVSKKQPEQELGLYWGYTVRIAHNIKAVFKGEEPYTKTVLVDSKIKQHTRFPKLSPSLPTITSQDSVLLVFAGYEGLEAMIQNDQGCKVTLKEIISEVDSIYEFCKFGVKQLRIEEQLFLMLSKVDHLTRQ